MHFWNNEFRTIFSFHVLITSMSITIPDNVHLCNKSNIGIHEATPTSQNCITNELRISCLCLSMAPCCRRWSTLLFIDITTSISAVNLFRLTVLLVIDLSRAAADRTARDRSLNSSGPIKTYMINKLGQKSFSIISNLQPYFYAGTVRCRYSAVNFLQISHNWHPIAPPWGRGMGCLLWIWNRYLAGAQNPWDTWHMIEHAACRWAHCNMVLGIAIDSYLHTWWRHKMK